MQVFRIVFKGIIVSSIAVFIFTGCKKETIGNNQAIEPLSFISKAVPSTPKSLHESADVALDWYKLQFRFLLERNASFNGGLFFGYIGIGLYESVRYGISNSVSLSTQLYQMPAMPARENNNGYNWKVSANAAMASMVRSFYSGLTNANKASIDSLENAYNQNVNPGPGSETFQRSQAFGRAIATAIYNWFKTDQINTSNVGYVWPVFPGSWVPTPPAFGNPVNPYFGAGRPFLSADLTAIAPRFAIPYSETPGSAFYNMVNNVYQVSKTLTADQKTTALFWVDQGDKVAYTPAGHDMYIVTQALEQTNANLGKAAEVYAKAGIAERDGAIVTFRSKYDNNLIRPVTYIRKVIDATWSPFIPTPPHPEYPAAHAGVTGSVMQILNRELGDNVSFTDHTYEFRGFAPRTYSSFFAAAEDAGMSRLYGGIHYAPSIQAGLALAREVGNRVSDIKLQQ
jgi:hypothetical protein